MAHILRVLCIIALCLPLEATSLVYNLRIRRVFTGLSSFVQLEKKSFWAISSVPILYKRRGHITQERFGTDVCDTRRGGGSIFNVRYIPSRSWWLEATTAVQKESVTTTGTSNFTASRTGFDDVVFAGGYNSFPSKDIQVTLYGLVGFPTKKSVSLQEAQDRLVGTRFYALGGGGELSHSFINTAKQLLAGIIQVRVIHFFKRRWEPILPIGSFIQPGQGTDILFSMRYRYKLTVFETGYNPTIFTNQAILLPEETIKTRTAVRHGTYATIIHLFTKSRLTGQPIALGAGFLFNRFPRFDLNYLSGYLNITFLF